MTPRELNKIYFSRNTRGYNIIYKFYHKYYDLFYSTCNISYNDFLNQIYLNISNIDFSKDIKNVEAYITASIKIQCRVQLDRSIKLKKIISESKLKKEENESNSILEINSERKEISPAEILEGSEILQNISLFKFSLNSNEIELLNYLIDEKTRKEIVENTGMNINTLDTQIRRLRIKFYNFLKKLGYNLNSYSKYEK